MSQLSRPYQIALVTLALLAAVWFVALRGHSSSTQTGSGSTSGSAGSSASASATSAAAEAKAAAAPSKVYHGPAPGVEGLTRAIDKAHGAVAQSQREAHRVETSEPSASSAAGSGSSSGSAASGSSSGSSSSHGSSSGASALHSASSAAGSSASPVSSSSASSSHAAGSSSSHVAGSSSHPSLASPSETASRSSAKAVPSHSAGPSPATGASRAHPKASGLRMQALVEGELRAHKTVLILFWNNRGAEDAAVHSALPAVQRALRGKVAVHYATAGQVGEFGTVTHAVQVTQTPTLLIVNERGQTTVLTGLSDAFAIEQAVREARRG